MLVEYLSLLFFSLGCLSHHIRVSHMTGQFELGRNTQNVWLWDGPGSRSEKDSIAGMVAISTTMMKKRHSNNWEGLLLLEVSLNVIEE